MKIDANAERGDKSAKLVVKVDLEGSWAAFGKDLGGSGPPSWSQVKPSWSFWRLLGALGRLLGASWFPRAANMVARAS